MKTTLDIKKNEILTFTANEFDLIVKYKKNRPINKVSVTNMVNSIKRNGVIRNLILVKYKNKYLLVDGQHLFEAIKILGIEEIDAIIVDCEDETEITNLMIDTNNTSKSWKLTDYIHSWKESGYVDYRHLQTANDLTYADIQISVIMQAYSQMSRQVVSKMVKQGTFKIKDKAYGEILLNCVSDCVSIIPNTRPINEALIKLMLSVDEYNHIHMVKKLKAVSKKIIFSGSEKQVYPQLLEIYESK